jgi:hypothetical protein
VQIPATDRVWQRRPGQHGDDQRQGSAVDVSDVTSYADDPESHQYCRIFSAVRDDIVVVLNGMPQNEVPHRVPISDGRWRIVPGSGAGRRSGAKLSRRRRK